MNSKSTRIAFLILILGGIVNSMYADTIPTSNLDTLTPSSLVIIKDNDTTQAIQKEKGVLSTDTLSNELFNIDNQSTIIIDEVQNKTLKPKKLQAEIDPESYHARKAAIWGALPGGGQIYNKRWWKVPIAWAMIGAGGFFIYNSASNMRTYNQALEMRNNGLADEFSGILTETQIISYRNTYRRNLQLSAFGTIGLWSLTILDAVVDAHLKTYDISDDLSIKFKPKILRLHNNSVPSFAITLYL